MDKSTDEQMQIIIDGAPDMIDIKSYNEFLESLQTNQFGMQGNTFIVPIGRAFNFDSGALAGWKVFKDRIEDSNENIRIDSRNAFIRVGNTTSSNIIIDGGNSLIRSSNYTSGTSGFLISPDLIEAENLYARGKLSSVVFEYNVQQAVGGQLVVSSSDKLAEDMTADDDST